MFKGRHTLVDIDLSAFTHNLSVASGLAGRGVTVMPIIKADGYGHGAVPLARAASAMGFECFGVATVGEGLNLRASGLKVNVLVLGGFPSGAEDEAIEKNLTPVVFDLSSAERLNSRAGKSNNGPLPVHLKIDTKMGRLGFLPGRVREVARKIASFANLRVEGVMTHYARADEENNEGPTMEQVAIFEKSLKVLAEEGLTPRWIHTVNSAALLLDRGPRYNMVRPGIMLYGAVPDGLGSRPEKYSLRPVMTFRTEIIQLRKVPAQWPISYGGRYVTTEEQLIAVLSVGYADGFMRYNSAQGEVLVRGKRVPVVGTVCMDLTMIDVSGIEGVTVGDEVVIVGNQGDETILASEVARRGETISYELFCNVTSRVPRFYNHREG